MSLLHFNYFYVLAISFLILFNVSLFHFSQINLIILNYNYMHFIYSVTYEFGLFDVWISQSLFRPIKCQ